MAYSSGQAQYRLAYELQPIALTGGSASGLPGGVLGIFSIMESLNFGSLTGSSDMSLDDAFANFYPIAGSSLIDLQIGNYPFANMTVAANATIRQPLVVSMLMRVPVKQPGGYALKTQIMTSLQNTLDQHIQGGGTFSVATPSFFYSDLILVRLHDVSGGETIQAQYQYQWDFIKPLVTTEDAAGAQNAMMSRLSSGVQTDGALSGIPGSTGQPTTLAGASLIPAQSGSVGPGGIGHA